jgi:hypothetical protein
MKARAKWISVIADVVVYELGADEGQLLSEYCDILIDRHPVLARAFIVGAGAVLVAHLANVAPARYDIVGREFWRNGRRVRRFLRRTGDPVVVVGEPAVIAAN